MLYSRAKSTGAAKKTPELLSLLSIRGDKFPDEALAECASSALLALKKEYSQVVEKTVHGYMAGMMR